MLPKENALGGRPDSLREDSDVDFSAFDLLASNSAAIDEHGVDSLGFGSMSPAFIPEEAEEVKANARLDAEDAHSGLRVDSSDPLLYEIEFPGDANANSPPAPSHKSHANPRPNQLRFPSANSATLAFGDAVTAENGYSTYPAGPLHGLDHSDDFKSHGIQFAGRRRSQSVPPNDHAFRRQLVSGNMLHIGRAPNRRPAGPVQRSHPYENAYLKRLNGGQISYSQRLAKVPQQTSRGHPYSPVNSIIDAAALDTSQTPTNLEPARQHRDGAIDGPRPKQTPVRLVALTEAQYLCERMLYRLAMATEGTRRDAIMMGQDPNFEITRCPQRVANASVNTLDQPLAILTLPFGHNGDIPGDGRALRNLGGNDIDALLRAYDMPVSPDMFVFEKKLLYLQFIGVSKGLMRLILD